MKKDNSCNECNCIYLKKNKKSKQKQQQPHRTFTLILKIRLKNKIWVAYAAMLRSTYVGRNMEVLTITSHRTSRIIKE